MVLPDESPAMSPRVLVDLAHAAEDLGYRTAWLPDHVLPPADYGSTYGGVYEPLVTIGHLAAVTTELGALVLPGCCSEVPVKSITALRRSRSTATETAMTAPASVS